MSGIIYGLIAVGFVLIYKATGIFNFAQGQLVVIGTGISWSALVSWNLHPVLAIVVSLLIAACLGLGLERFPMHAMLGQSLLPQVMVTIAIGGLLDAILIYLYGGPWKSYPELLPAGTITLGQISVAQAQVWASLIALLIFGGLLLFFRYTKMGLAMRAVAEDTQLGQSLGMGVNRIMSLTWMLATVVAAMGGILLGYVKGGLGIELTSLGLIAMPAALVGGMNSIEGTILGGILIGVASTLATTYIGRGVGEVFAFIILVVVIFVRPYGLLGLKRIERV